MGAGAIVDALSKGGKKLDCYDGRLVRLCKNLGFEEPERFPWAERYAHPTWNYERFVRPDVVMLE